MRVNLACASPLDFKIWKSKFGYFGHSVTSAEVVELVAQSDLTDDDGERENVGVACRKELPNRNVFITMNVHANCNHIEPRRMFLRS